MAHQKSLVEIVEERIASGDMELPVFDRTALKMREMVDCGEFQPEAVEKLVGSDPVLSGALLQCANSSFFGGIEKVVTVRDAIVRLGVKQVAELVILSKQKELYEFKHGMLHDVATSLWQHSVACGTGAQWLAKELQLGERTREAFLAGLLHDIGKLLLLRVIDDLIENKSFQPSEKLVLELLDSLHCSQGVVLMEYWNFPEAYVRVARSHHDDEYDESDTLISLIRLVDMACNKLGIGIRGEVETSLAASAEAQRLRASEITLARLELQLDDAMALAD